MSSYFCIRCGYSTSHKGTFLRHLERTKPCKPKLGKIEKSAIYLHNDLVMPENLVAEKSAEKTAGLPDDQTGKPALVTQGSRLAAYQGSRNNQKRLTFLHNKKNGYQIQKSGKNNENISSNQNEITCKFCGKIFQHKQSKYRHEKYRCKFINKGNIKLINQQKEALQEKNRVIEEKNKLIESLLKKGSFISNQSEKNNKNILSYDNTNKKFLTDEMISKCMEKQNMCVPEMIKLVHFNNIHPENRNIYISNLKTNYVMVYEDEKWIVKNRDQMLDKLIADNEKFMHKKLTEWYDEGTDNDKYKRAIKKFQKYLDVNSNTNLIDNIKDELKLMFYNNRGKNMSVLKDYIVTEIK